jgi:hypothetical protein
MQQTLSDPHDKQRVGFPLVIHRQLSEHLCEAGVVRSRTDEAHCEDRIECYTNIAIVGVF